MCWVYATKFFLMVCGIRSNLRYRRPQRAIAQGYVSEVMMGVLWVDRYIPIGWSPKIMCGLFLYAFSS